MYIQPARLAPRARGRAGAGGERPAGAAAESRTGGSKLQLKLPKTLIVKVRTLQLPMTLSARQLCLESNFLYEVPAQGLIQSRTADKI